METVNKRLELIRIKHFGAHGGRAKFSKILGIPVENLKNYETRNNNIPIAILRKVVDTTGVNLHFLLLGDKPEYTKDYLAPEIVDRIPKMNLCPAAGIKDLTWYVMRHTFASLLAQAGVDIFKIATWIGDSVATTVNHYARLKDGYNPEIEV